MSAYTVNISGLFGGFLEDILMFSITVSQVLMPCL